MITEGIVGHQKQIEFLKRAIERDKLAHAYVFAGPEGIGKRTVALRLAKHLLQTEAASHPDLLVISSEGQIKIEEIRGLIYKLSLKPYSAPYKVAILDDAADMNKEAQNALLKSLEEPKDHTVIILITASADTLPKTILSRVQRINFGLLKTEELQALLPADLSKQQRESILQMSMHKPGWLKRILTKDEAFVATLTKADEELRKIGSHDLIEKLKLAAELAEEETTTIKSALFVWLTRLETDLRQSPNSSVVAKISAVSQALYYLDRNVNAKLLLSNLMLQS